MIPIRFNILFVLFFLPAALLPTAPAFSQGLIIPSGAYVIGNTGYIVLRNNWVNNGSFTHNGGTLIFAGTSQSLGGTSPSTFNNITIAATSATTIVTNSFFIFCSLGLHV